MFLETLDNQTRLFEPALVETLRPDAAVAAHLTTSSPAGQLGPAPLPHAHALPPQQPIHSSLPCFNDLIAVLIECFSLIAIGYLSGRFKLISPDAKDLGAYLTTFALPMIIFLNIAQMESHTINLAFLASMLVSKLLLFLLVSAITLVVSYPSNFSYAGALSILATQSNDFALGYPLFKSLYGESRPEMLGYLNLMGPIQLLIINPLGIIMLEFGKSRASRLQRRRANSLRAKRTCARCVGAAGGATCSPRLAQPATTISAGGAQDGEPIYEPSRRSAPDPLTAGDHHQLIGDFRSLGVGHAAVTTTTTNNNNNNNKDDQVHHRKHLDYARLRRKNIKSLTLAMPATVMSERSFSDESLESLGCGQQQQQQHEVAESRTATPTLYSELSSPDDSLGGPKVPSGYMKPKWYSPTSVDQLPVNHSEAEHQRLPLGGCGGMRTPTECDCWRGSSSGLAEPKEPLIDLSFVRALLTNPLIIASVVALAVNLLYGPALPKFVTKVSNTIAASFAAPALLVVGLSMYGKFKLILRNPNDLLLASVLVMTKVLILPNVMRAIMQMLLPHYADAQEITYLADFAYLYGLLPTAPGACIIAKQYEVLTNVVSICMLLSTFISAPLMLGTSAVISKAATITPDAIFGILAQTLRAASSVTLTLSLLTLYLLWKSSRRISGSFQRAMRHAVDLKTAHLLTFLLALAQLLVGMGGFMWLFVDTAKMRHLAGLLHSALVGECQSGDEDDNSLAAMAAAAEPQPLAQWPRSIGDHEEGDDDLLAQEERLHFLSVHPTLMSPQTASVLCTLEFVLSSSGILLARFVILCIVVTNFARHLRGHLLASQVASLMVRVLPLFAGGIVLCLLLESKHSGCLPSESSLPRWPVSLYLRLIFNVLLLGLAVPLFALTFRLQNKAAACFRAGEGSSVCDLTAGPGSLRRRRFVTSNVSLTSETSSAITTSTNLEATMTGVNNIQGSSSRTLAPQRTSLHPCAMTTIADNEPASILVQYNHQPTTSVHEQQRLQTGFVNSGQVSSKGCGGSGTTAGCDKSPKGDEFASDCGPLRTHMDGAIRQPDDLEEAPAHQSQLGGISAPVLELNKHSMLIVFMLFQALLSLTSIVQMLQQDKSSTGGTFIMVELTNVAVDFGQGLVTFLVIGTQTFLKDLISSFGPPRQPAAATRA